MPIYETIIVQTTPEGQQHILDDIRTIAALSVDTAKIEALRLNPPPYEAPSNQITVLVREFK